MQTDTYARWIAVDGAARKSGAARPAPLAPGFSG